MDPWYGNGGLDAACCWAKIAIVGIAKRLEEIYFPGDSVPLYLDKNSETLKLIQKLRNEAHRFGITFHRLKRSGSMTSSFLEKIPGIGIASIEKLFTRFKSIDGIKKASIEDLSEEVGMSRAKILHAHFSLKDR